MSNEGKGNSLSKLEVVDKKKSRSITINQRQKGKKEEKGVKWETGSDKQQIIRKWFGQGKGFKVQASFFDNVSHFPDSTGCVQLFWRVVELQDSSFQFPRGVLNPGDSVILIRIKSLEGRAEGFMFMFYSQDHFCCINGI